MGVGQYRVVVYRVANGAASKLAHHHVVGLELVINAFCHVVVDDDGVPLAQTITGQKVFIHMGFDINQGLINPDDVGFAQFG